MPHIARLRISSTVAILTLLLMSSVVITLSSAPSTRAQAAVTTVSLGPGSDPIGVAYDAGRGEIFVTDFQQNRVDVLSDATNNVVTTIHVGQGPEGIVYDSDKGYIYVANEFDNISVISDSSDQVIATVPVSGGYNPVGPFDMAFDPSNGNVYFESGGFEHSFLVAISDTTNRVVQNVSISPFEGSIVFDPDTGNLYLSDCCGGEHGSNLWIYSVTQNRIVQNLTVTPNRNPSLGFSTEALAVDPSKGYVYVSYYLENSTLTPTSYTRIAVLSDRTNSIIQTIDITPGLPSPICYSICSGFPLGGMVFDSSTGLLYVAEQLPNSYSVELKVITDQNNTVVDDIPIGTDNSNALDGDAANGMASDAVCSCVYFANSGAGNLTVVAENITSATGSTTISSGSSESSSQSSISTASATSYTTSETSSSETSGTSSTNCVISQNLNQNKQLNLNFGIAQTNLWNTFASQGSVTMCYYLSTGLETSVSLMGIQLSQTATPVAGYPEAAYGENLLGDPFGSQSSDFVEFPAQVSSLKSDNIWANISYSVSNSHPISLDVGYDLWIKSQPSGDPVPSDYELLILPFDSYSRHCSISNLYSNEIYLDSQATPVTWKVCEQQGSGGATLYSFSLSSSEIPSGAVDLRPYDFISYLATDLTSTPIGGYSLMGIEFGTEFAPDQPSSQASMSWSITQFSLNSGSKVVYLIQTQGVSSTTTSVSTNETSTNSSAQPSTSGIPEFPFQFLALVGVSAIVTLSYLAATARRRKRR